MKYSTVIPTLRYKDAKKAIQFLTNGLGFIEAACYEDDKGVVLHAELSRGNGMIMLGTTPDQNNSERLQMNLGASSIYVIVDSDSEVDEIYNSAIKAGAKSVRSPENQDYGGRGATVKDSEDHYWSIGSYKPEI